MLPEVFDIFVEFISTIPLTKKTPLVPLAILFGAVPEMLTEDPAGIVTPALNRRVLV